MLSSNNSLEQKPISPIRYMFKWLVTNYNIK